MLSLTVALLGSLAAGPALAITVPSSTGMTVRTLETIDSRRMGNNAKFTAVLEGNLTVDGVVAVPAGAKVYGQLFEVKKSRRIVGKAEVTMALVQINVGGDLLKIRTSGVKAVGEGKGKKTARKAAAGAAIGAMFGGGKGAATGAAVGATAALVTQGDQINIPAKTLLEFTLADALKIPGKGTPAQAAAAPAAAAPIDTTDLAMKVAQARRKAGKALMSYNWKQRTEISRSGKSEYVRLELVRYDLDGNLQRTQLSENGTNKGAMKELMQSLPTLRPYALPSAGDVLDFIEAADVSEQEGVLVAVGRDVLQSGDELTLRIDPKTYDVIHAKVRAQVGAETATGTIEYRKAADTVYPIRARIKVGDDVEVVVEAFDVSKG